MTARWEVGGRWTEDSLLEHLHYLGRYLSRMYETCL